MADNFDENESVVLMSLFLENGIPTGENTSVACWNKTTSFSLNHISGEKWMSGSNQDKHWSYEKGTTILTAKLW